jgi:hypothetical protein
VGVHSGGSGRRRKEVRIDATGITVTRDSGPEPAPQGPPPPPPGNPSETGPVS